MIENTQPVRLAIRSTYTGYRQTYVLHSSYSDLDVVGKAIWLDSVIQPVQLGLDTLYFFVTSLTPNTGYSVEAAFYDAMVDADLRAARFGMHISTPTAFTTREEPTISSFTVTSEEVDVGVAPPVLNMVLGGSADQVEVQWSVANANSWTTVYFGGFSNDLSVPNLPVGQLIDIRVRGIVVFPDGQSTESSNWSQLEDLKLDWGYTPPSAPTNLTFQTAYLREPADRYDVRVSWDWSKSTGANAREFIVWRIDKQLYDSNPVNNKWAGAELTNVGTSKSTVIINHPFDRAQVYRVAAVAWGPESDSVTYSSEVIHTINASTPIDDDFTTQTGIEVTYSHIRGLLNDGGTWKQTFNVDAATGNVTIGLLDAQGKAPISFTSDGSGGGTVNVNGGVISETINAANFVLSNFDGTTSPALYSEAKASYGDPSEGIWMGHETTGGYRFLFDLGNSTKYIRWDGDTLRISGDVVIGTPGGDAPFYSDYRKIYIKTTGANPTQPTSTTYPPTGWSKTPPVRATGEVIWECTGYVNLSTDTLITGETWSAFTQSSGDDGTIGQDGAPGAGIYAQDIVNFTGTFDETQAATWFTNNFGRSMVTYDVLTQYDPAAPTTAATRMWDGSVWTTPALVVHGDMIVDGTVRAEAIVAESGIVNKLGAEVIYDKAAYEGLDPETDYTMKIDLVNGSIHIR